MNKGHNDDGANKGKGQCPLPKPSGLNLGIDEINDDHNGRTDQAGHGVHVQGEYMTAGQRSHTAHHGAAGNGIHLGRIAAGKLVLHLVHLVGKENGENDPFISSLIHDSIIVQIPLLHGKINNRLDKVLSVFDQSQRTEESQQIINLEENLYKDDPEMMQIIHRLSLATMSAEVRQEMNDEDEFFAVIEARDADTLSPSIRI